MRLYGVMKSVLKNVEVHDLWLVACFLYPFLRDMSFWCDCAQKEYFKKRAEALTRILCESPPVEKSDCAAGHTNGSNSHPLLAIVVLATHLLTMVSAKTTTVNNPHRRKQVCAQGPYFRTSRY